MRAISDFTSNVCRRPDSIPLKEGRLKRVNPAAMARLADYSTLPLRIRPLI